ncbi:transporter substrate-binding domain-containing protein [Zooshikella marina]|uniref:substrate-binding periplasmic protein n=1 Tax=Zooshikella ganghwensis TaxID=202772 RepID=UPI001BB09883|nr:transporter substrate-binding domain-containing protein [Zooshikella ganghwensis]MBU2708336.1 transporter substrate-binding domain-containing protein [Zooshikella ganghwensis]
MFIKIIAVLFSMIASFSFSSEKIRIAIGEYPPYLSEDLKYYGLAAHIVREAFSLVNIKVEYGFYPWARSYEYVKAGHWDATIIWVYTEERAKYFYYSDAIITGPAVFFHLKSMRFDWRTMKDLENLTIGGVLAASYTWYDEAVAKGIHLKMERVPLDKMNFDKLLKRRIPITTMDLNLGLFILNTQFDTAAQDEVTYHPKVITTYVYHMLFSKKKPKNLYKVKLFNKGLKMLQEQGRVDQFILESRRGEYIKSPES